MKLPETYTAVVLSTAHLPREDAEALDSLHAADGGMVLSTGYGFLVKLYTSEPENRRDTLSEGTNNLLAWALDAGHRLVEFDRDGPTVDGLPTFDW